MAELDVKKHYKVPEEIYVMTETSLDDAHTLSRDKLWSHQGTHTRSVVCLPEISRTSERVPSSGRRMRFLKSLCQALATTERDDEDGQVPEGVEVHK